MAEEDTIELAQTLFNDPRVWFYHVPTTQVSTLTPRADAWDPEHPFLTGSLQVLQRGDACWIQLFEPLAEGSETRTLLAQCPVEISQDQTLEAFVQDCADSSRYFMIRVEDEQTKRRAFIGIGFPERPSAFNFKAALQDYVKYVHRQMEVAALAAASAQGDGTTSTAAAEQKPSDLSIPKGSTIRINLKLNASEKGEYRHRSSADSQDSGGGTPKVPLIPPPPADPLALSSPANKTAQTMSATSVDDEDWGDFTSA
ncbi:hypothetical protein Poli38472_012849 [Pythium oligandrum]|uniref:NECAP PHear domain-containing protein n=1 Tax=Pythium oligandrum TaxID=41045 RepID=A0A8K1CL16_PYTOL|nr:hypothetical protein Poli38472_012849 [Pythium oligandrum]|eukprot:TMW64227.1 hypothetical protein Poli38472_012849 [Pythium oligandrum]